MIFISRTVSGRWKRRHRGCSLICKEALKEGSEIDWFINSVKSNFLIASKHSNPPDWWRITGRAFSGSNILNCDTLRLYITSVNSRGVFIVYSSWAERTDLTYSLKFDVRTVRSWAARWAQKTRRPPRDQRWSTKTCGRMERRRRGRWNCSCSVSHGTSCVCVSFSAGLCVRKAPAKDFVSQCYLSHASIKTTRQYFATRLGEINMFSMRLRYDMRFDSISDG